MLERVEYGDFIISTNELQRQQNDVPKVMT
jgi:hypothetical protein